MKDKVKLAFTAMKPAAKFVLPFLIGAGLMLGNDQSVDWNKLVTCIMGASE